MLQIESAIDYRDLTEGDATKVFDYFNQLLGKIFETSVSRYIYNNGDFIRRSCNLAVSVCHDPTERLRMLQIFKKGYEPQSLKETIVQFPSMKILRDFIVSMPDRCKCVLK